MKARLDERLHVQVVARRELRYTRPARVADRPPHVRAASAMAIGDAIYVVQDDASFIGVIEGNEIDAIAVPHVVGGRRRFEEALGNKHDKLDLEACVLDGDRLIAFGSGSLPIREQVCVVRDRIATVVPAAAVYAALRAAIGGAVNLEGAALLGEQLWLFHRGNGGGGDRPAIVQLDRRELDAICRGDAPAIASVVHCDLGSIDGVRLGFTDATSDGDRVWIACAAEASRDAIADGAVTGSRIGVIDGDVIRCAEVLLDGAPCKIEGLAIERGSGRGYITTDPDDPEKPAVLCELMILDATLRVTRTPGAV